MSRRITLVALAASVSLIATQASADRECFDDSCRQQEVAEPQAQATTEVAAPANKPIPDFVAPETAAAATSADASEARADAKPEPKSESKPEPKLEAKAESKPEPKPEPALVPAATTKLQPYTP